MYKLLSIFSVFFLAVVVSACDKQAHNSAEKEGQENREIARPEAPADASENTENAKKATTESDTTKDLQDRAKASQPQQAQLQPAEQSVWVMEAKGSRQCEGGGKTLQQSSARLLENGITVQQSSCGVRTDRMYPSVCGGATGDILLHKVPGKFLDAALELGFDPAKTGQYQSGQCATANSGSSTYK